MLNRTTRIVRNPDSASPDKPTLDEMVEFEAKLADTTRTLAEGLEARSDVSCDFLYEAEKVMLKSVDRLRESKFPPSADRQAEALALLIKARKAMRAVFGKSSASAAAQKFDREQMQKLRKPPSEDEQAELLVAKLEELAEEERIVYETLGGVPSEQGSPSETASNASAPSSGQSTTQEDPEDSEKKQEPDQEGPGELASRQELEQRQYEIVLDAYEIQKLMEGTESMTELAEGRMARSIKEAEAASEAMLRGDTDTARESAGEASRSLKELARHVAGLTARDLAEKIGAARDLSADLAEEHRDLASRLDGDTPPGSPAPSGAQAGAQSEGKEGGPASSSPGGEGQQAGKQGQGEAGEGQGVSGRGGPGELAEQSEPLGEAGRTLEDLLGALTRDGEVDGELAARLEVALATADLETLLGEIEAIEESLRGRQVGNLHLDVGEVAERLEVLSGVLDALHGMVVSPRLAELLELESQVASLRERLDKLTTDAEISRWHLDAQQLMETLEKAEAGTVAVETLRRVMEEAGWGTNRSEWGWNRVHDNVLQFHYQAPAEYVSNLTLLEEMLQREAKELLLRDMISSGDDAVPPAYEKLVERYFEVLSREKKAE